MRRVRLSWGLLTLCACASPGPPQPAEGCWVHAFAGDQPYRPPATTYTGPTHERHFMQGARSLIVGPAARLEAPDERLAPGTRVPELTALDSFRRGEPFQLVCLDQPGVR